MSRRGFHFQLAMICYSAFFTGINVRGEHTAMAIVMAALTVIMVLLAEHEARKLERHAYVEVEKAAALLLSISRQLAAALKRGAP